MMTWLGPPNKAYVHICILYHFLLNSELFYLPLRSLIAPLFIVLRRSLTPLS
jgi:hypothetical protein